MSQAVLTSPTHTDTHAIERRPAAMAIWWIICSEIMIFGGFIAVYILYHAASHGAFHEAAEHLNAAIATVNTVVLLTSSLTVAMAHSAAESERWDAARNFLGWTVLLGLTFLGIKAFEYSTEIAHGFTPKAGMFWAFYYALTGLHALHLIAGTLVNFTFFLSGARGRLERHGAKRLEAAGLYWHFVDVVWVFLFPLLYLSS